jgi:hypothetical protein
MNKKIGILLVTICISSLGYAQLSTRENTISVFKTGSRPQAGSYGLYVGPSFMEITDMVDDDIDVRGIPLINLKLYKSNEFEWRLGLQFSGKSKTLKGTQTSGATSNDVTSKEKNSYNRISIGGAYHFSPKNLLDVYIGAYVPFGWDTYRNEQSVGNSSISTSKFSPVIGVGSFIGLQAFVADLPISIGLEYGLRGIVRFRNQYKNEVTNSGKTETYYTEDENGKGSPYSDLAIRKSDFGTDARITFSYYFNR